MSDSDAEDPFVTTASAHIDLANAQAADQPRELVAVAFMHAAARYNAFVGSGTARSAGELTALRDELIAAQVDQFRDALAHHYAGYIAELATEKTD